MANEKFGTLVTENMGGYTWYKNCRLNRITSWENQPSFDIPSEIIYLKDEENGAKWDCGDGAGYCIKKIPMNSIQVGSTQDRKDRAYSFFVLAMQALTASMTALLIPSFSRVLTPSMVVPAGEQTMSFSSPGCFPVSNTIFALPRTA